MGGLTLGRKHGVDEQDFFLKVELYLLLLTIWAGLQEGAPAGLQRFAQSVADRVVAAEKVGYKLDWLSLHVNVRLLVWSLVGRGAVGWPPRLATVAEFVDHSLAGTQRSHAANTPLKRVLLPHLPYVSLSSCPSRHHLRFTPAVLPAAAGCPVGPQPSHEQQRGCATHSAAAVRPP